jgi:hypothetical protein
LGIAEIELWDFFCDLNASITQTAFFPPKAPHYIHHTTLNLPEGTLASPPLCVQCATSHAYFAPYRGVATPSLPASVGQLCGSSGSRRSRWVQVVTHSEERRSQNSTKMWSQKQLQPLTIDK